eukprot:CAMPEP_0197643570 /NCGR_PEP_ID=MMETSP1338-20131121/16842_1 /TAXON_ID=43686 ORGANISM="Pelagodinium beii, Strain RCC1491" /NCGR_SAMPLE_ID=MMETSP1338 /ASSEMBLY_ACC=CAM_ASM_000754 /LENGTH=151 /DNA_ID=CAMNT_0043216835 /DNA_START=98 /DNA_END=553 /DNA_ORIENTATION=+
MVFFTIFATLDSVTLLAAMTGLLTSCSFSLKTIADLEYDMKNSSDFFQSYNFHFNCETGFLILNLVAIAPFLLDWWLAPIQAVWGVVRVLRALSGGNKVPEKDVFKPSVYNAQRRWQMAGFFLYLVSIFIYFARAVAAVMDIHIHGITPYD